MTEKDMGQIPHSDTWDSHIPHRPLSASDWANKPGHAFGHEPTNLVEGSSLDLSPKPFPEISPYKHLKGDITSTPMTEACEEDLQIGQRVESLPPLKKYVDRTGRFIAIHAPERVAVTFGRPPRGFAR